GEVFPRAGDAAHFGLPAELALGADFAGHAGDFGGERIELIDHRVDGVFELEDLSLDVDRDLLGEVSFGDGGGHQGDVTDLSGEFRPHQFAVVGQVLPDSRHALHFGLPAELAVGAYFFGDARHLGGERVELIDHRVDGVLHFEHFALGVDR